MNRWSAVCGESRMHGAGRGKRRTVTARNVVESLTYRHSFFVTPTISTMTSGTASQNFDLGGLSFPRRFGVRFHVDYLKKYGFIGMQARWDAFSDKRFQDSLGPDFHHEDMIGREGWAMYYFKGKFERDVGYVRLQVTNPGTGMLIHTFWTRGIT